mgnify:FL=1|jgi:glycerol-3-phosphate dehydrogenase (NAD(P)+)
MKTVSVFGAGSWGTALADLLARNGHDVVLWCRRSEQAHAITATGINPGYLSSARIHPAVAPTSDIRDAAEHSDLWVLAVPTQAVRGLLSNLAPLRNQVAICNAAKGFEIGTMLRISEIVKLILPEASYTVLSGPSFAEEVIAGLPTAAVAASVDEPVAADWQRRFSTLYFRVYSGADVIGVEVGGAVKNVVAIAVGAARGLRLGDNAVAALITRGLAEISRLGTAMGAQPKTFSGLTGIGDLILTCYSSKSRNFRLGLEIGSGKSLDEARSSVGQVAEGAFTVKAVVSMAERYSVEMPIAGAVWNILYGGKRLSDVMTSLLTRDLKPEDIVPGCPPKYGAL